MSEIEEIKAAFNSRGYAFRPQPQPYGRGDVIDGLYQWERKRGAPEIHGAPSFGSGRPAAAREGIARIDEARRWTRHGGEPQEHLTVWGRLALKRKPRIADHAKAGNARRLRTFMADYHAGKFA